MPAIRSKYNGESASTVPFQRKPSGTKLVRAAGVRPTTFKFNGIQLKPTVVFDTFWKWVAERQAIDERRRRGKSPPWSDNPNIRDYRFCNCYRVSDRCSQYIIRQVIEKGSQDIVDVVFRVVLFNLFTKVETYELLEERLGPLTWKSYDPVKYRRVLREAKQDGRTLYTGAFQKPAPKFGHAEAHLNHLDFLELLMTHDLPQKLSEFSYMADAFEWLASFQGMGDFTTYQLLLNLSYTSAINFSDSDFVVAGLGARSGLFKCFKLRDTSIEVDVMRWMQETQDEHFARLGLEFNGLGDKHLPLQLCDIEHSLCEVDKFARLVHPSIPGLYGRTEVGSKYHPSEASPLPPLHLPKAWSHPDRKRVRIRPGPPRKIVKRYVVERIEKERIRDGKKEYLIYWTGYPSSQATWEPASAIKEDAADAIKHYIAKR